jgi:hypothetical protein
MFACQRFGGACLILCEVPRNLTHQAPISAPSVVAQRVPLAHSTRHPGRTAGPLSKQVLPCPPPRSVALNCEGFRMTAPSRADPRHPGPSSESLQGRNPRDVGRSDAARSMGISTRSLRMRPLMTCGTERLRSRVVVATRLGSLGNRGARPIWSLRDAGSDERCCGRS